MRSAQIARGNFVLSSSTSSPYVSVLDGQHYTTLVHHLRDTECRTMHPKFLFHVPCFPFDSPVYPLYTPCLIITIILVMSILGPEFPEIMFKGVSHFGRLPRGSRSSGVAII